MMSLRPMIWDSTDQKVDQVLPKNVGESVMITTYRQLLPVVTAMGESRDAVSNYINDIQINGKT